MKTNKHNLGIINAGITILVLLSSVSISLSANSFILNDKTNTSRNTIKSNNELGKRYLKLGNTYREAGDNANAYEYLSKGMRQFARQRNIEEKYWYATANELLGYYYRNLNDMYNALEHFNTADRIYDKILIQADGSQYAIDGVVKGMRNSKHSTPPATKPNFNDNHTKYLEVATNSQARDKDEATTENFDGRGLTDFPSEYTGSQISNLSIANNNIVLFPERILKFWMLRYLDISNNQIEIFPSMNHLLMLEYVNLSNNRITSIGSTIGDIRNLKHLNLSNNQLLTTISQEIYKLKNCLKVLDIRNTAIPQYKINELIKKLPHTNVLYTMLKSPTPGGEEIEEGWGNEGDDWGEEEGEEWGEEEDLEEGF